MFGPARRADTDTAGCNGCLPLLPHVALSGLLHGGEEAGGGETVLGPCCPDGASEVWSCDREVSGY